METSRACRWVCRRLPLLAGGELAGGDRRRVERHLLACRACRDELAGASRNVEFLRGLGATTRPAADAAPSLWPDLARQIRESRREVRSLTPWTRSATRRPRLRAGLGLAAAAGLAALAVGALARPGPPRAERADHAVGRADPPAAVVGGGIIAPLAIEAHPDPTDASTSPASIRPDGPALPLVRANRRPSALPDGQPPYDTRGLDPFQIPWPLQRDYDLDRGTLPGARSQDTQRAY